MTSKFDCFTLVAAELVDEEVAALVFEFVLAAVAVPELLLAAVAAELFAAELVVPALVAAEESCRPSKLETSDTRALTTPVRIPTILPIVDMPWGSPAN
jgi:hypothetical protein